MKRNINDIKLDVLNKLKELKIQQILEKNFIKNEEEYFIYEVNNYYMNTTINKWSEKLYNYLYDIKREDITCKCCNNLTKFKAITTFTSYCSNKCIAKDKELLEKKKENYLNKTGYNNPLENPEVRDKIKQKQK